MAESTINKDDRTVLIWANGVSKSSHGCTVRVKPVEEAVGLVSTEDKNGSR